MSFFVTLFKLWKWHTKRLLLSFFLTSITGEFYGGRLDDYLIIKHFLNMSVYIILHLKARGLFSQNNSNLCLNERSTFCGFKKCKTTSQLNSDLFLRFFKVRP